MVVVVGLFELLIFLALAFVGFKTVRYFKKKLRKK